jgi:hypothetical protein
MDNNLPQWLSYLGGVIGIILASVIVRLGWMSKGPEGLAVGGNRTDTSRIMGAIVDSKSVLDLTLAVQVGNEILKAHGEIVENHGHELRNLGDEIRRLANKVDK